MEGWGAGGAAGSDRSAQHAVSTTQQAESRGPGQEGFRGRTVSCL